MTEEPAGLIREGRERRNDTVPWSKALEEALARRAVQVQSGSARWDQD